MVGKIDERVLFFFFSLFDILTKMDHLVYHTYVDEKSSQFISLYFYIL